MSLQSFPQNEDENITYKVEVSYIEIYNEKVRDLLCPRGYVNDIYVCTSQNIPV